MTEENGAAGSDAWIAGRDGATAADDKKVQIQGYASKASVPPGEAIDFHISSHVAQACTVEIYRLGHYGGVGARYLTTGEGVRVSPRPKPEADQVTGLIACDWPVSWTLDVPRTWVSGMAGNEEPDGPDAAAARLGPSSAAGSRAVRPVRPHRPAPAGVGQAVLRRSGTGRMDRGGGPDEDGRRGRGRACSGGGRECPASEQAGPVVAAPARAGEWSGGPGARGDSPV
ncbi:N,N-dimethylformamidase beta subunit family domain-containing protein [Streptomyces atroolivaceus]|uniref:N,N-dimethylformamidase beta subunit family domain-containing protein n=1 Tax=Streptomyces atroolivaceus TaxID=66869 RepID=UPI0036C69763